MIHADELKAKLKPMPCGYSQRDLLVERLLRNIEAHLYNISTRGYLEDIQHPISSSSLVDVERKIKITPAMSDDIFNTVNEYIQPYGYTVTSVSLRCSLGYLMAKIKFTTNPDNMVEPTSEKRSWIVRILDKIFTEDSM